MSHYSSDVRILCLPFECLAPAEAARTKQGLEAQMGTNHFAHFVLVAELLPLLVKTAGSRIVNVSSLMHQRVPSAAEMKRNIDGETFEAWPAYARSKLANMLFTFELSRRLRAAGHQYPHVLAAHPGYTETNLQFEGKSTFMRGVFHVANTFFAQHVSLGGIVS
jgi:NAD(P)-dependent dehydrogenase (short-subunit alcohol dehydrogenase family)